MFCFVFNNIDIILYIYLFIYFSIYFPIFILLKQMYMGFKREKSKGYIYIDESVFIY